MGNRRRQDDNEKYPSCTRQLTFRITHLASLTNLEILTMCIGKFDKLYIAKTRKSPLGPTPFPGFSSIRPRRRRTWGDLAIALTTTPPLLARRRKQCLCKIWRLKQGVIRAMKKWRIELLESWLPKFHYKTLTREDILFRLRSVCFLSLM